MNSGLEKAGWVIREISYVWELMGFIKSCFCLFGGGMGSAELLPRGEGDFSLPGSFGKAGFVLKDGWVCAEGCLICMTSLLHFRMLWQCWALGSWAFPSWLW